MQIAGGDSAKRGLRLLKVGSSKPYPEGPDIERIMESGPKNHTRDVFSGCNSLMVLYLDPLGYVLASTLERRTRARGDGLSKFREAYLGLEEHTQTFQRALK